MIYTILRERARQATIYRITNEIGMGTYFRIPSEMQATNKKWKLQAAAMLAEVIGEKAKSIAA